MKITASPRSLAAPGSVSRKAGALLLFDSFAANLGKEEYSMNVRVKKKELLAIPAAILSGFCNALLGAGGGVLLTLALEKLFGDSLSDRRDLLANSQAAMIAGCAVSCLLYGINGSLDTAGFSVFAIPAVLGGAAGSLLLTKINSKWIGRIFAVLVIWSGARMMLG